MKLRELADRLYSDVPGVAPNAGPSSGKAPESSPTNGQVHGDPEVELNRLASLTTAGPGDLSFIVSARHKDALKKTRASAVLVPTALANDPDFDVHTDLPCAALVCDSPYTLYAQASWILHPDEIDEQGIASTASIHPSAQIPASASVGEFAVIRAGVVLGENAVIGALCSIGVEARIGAQTRLMPRVTVAHNCVLGASCRVQSGAVIGSDGFGFAPTKAGWQAIHQTGRVVIGDSVHIGANTTIDRGTLDDTVIADGVILDNLIQIAHNIRIGENTAIAGCVGIAGSTVIGSNCQIGGACNIAGHLRIADNVVVNGGSTILRSIDVSGHYASGAPLMPVSRWRRAYLAFAQLENLTRRIRKLERT